MIVHKPWVGKKYLAEGIKGQRIAIMGFSHHHNPDTEADNDGFTISTIQAVCEGTLVHPYFTKVKNYFDSTVEHSEFWERVLFFNYLPNSVGADWYAWGSPKERQAAKDRLFEIIFGENSPEKLVILTKKGWEDVPLLVEEIRGDKLSHLSENLKDFQYGSYARKGKLVTAFGLMHPQYAPGDKMRDAVKIILEM